jgi:hypothetical protein
MKKFLIALTSLALACSSYDLTTPSQESLRGTWNLVSVNDNPLPYGVPSPGSSKVELVEDVVTISPPNKFTEISTFRNTQNGQVTTQNVTDSGTYEFNSYAVTFYFQSDGSIGSGTLTGRTMKIITSGVSFSYRKQ